jgi:hypothetical protein
MPEVRRLAMAAKDTGAPLEAGSRGPPEVPLLESARRHEAEGRGE